jgi:hypothetical protein
MLDVGAGELLPTAVDDVLGATSDPNPPVVGEHPRVTGVEPAVGVELRLVELGLV